eukprot:scaffold48919_cov33-Tisochrysis_lutea.AAC.1
MRGGAGRRAGEPAPTPAWRTAAHTSSTLNSIRSDASAQVDKRETKGRPTARVAQGLPPPLA